MACFDFQFPIAPLLRCWLCWHSFRRDAGLRHPDGEQEGGGGEKVRGRGG